MKSKNNFVMDEIIEKYADMVYRISFSMMKNEADAQDIFQEVFLRLVTNLDKIESEEHLKAWLIRVTSNCAKKHFSNYWNNHVYSFEDFEMQEQGEYDNYERVEGNCVVDALKQIPEKYRIPIHLFYYEQMSIKEIASTLNKKESSVKSLLFRGRDLLKNILKDEVAF